MARIKPFLVGHWHLLVTLAVIFALWTTSVVLPLKILVVYLHELSHGLAALATGGEIERINVSAQIGGFTMTRGGNRFAILSAGYLGSLLFGVCMLVLALRSAADRVVMAILGAVSIVVA
ncbi:M50 family metallopeptidase, partial [Litoreibacter sp.]|nr:M50 family metallopeptidase [Litoreibacter sp.]